MRFAKRHHTLYIEASAKTKDGVESAFEELVHKVIAEHFLLKGIGANYDQKNNNYRKWDVS